MFMRITSQFLVDLFVCCPEEAYTSIGGTKDPSDAIWLFIINHHQQSINQYLDLFKYIYHSQLRTNYSVCKILNSVGHVAFPSSNNEWHPRHDVQDLGSRVAPSPTAGPQLDSDQCVEPCGACGWLVADLWLIWADVWICLVGFQLLLQSIVERQCSQLATEASRILVGTLFSMTLMRIPSMIGDAGTSIDLKPRQWPPTEDCLNIECSPRVL